MHTGEFLRTLFPLRNDETDAAELVRFTVTSRDNPWPGTLHWRTRADLHALPGEGVEALGFETAGKDVYVTPHAFLRRDLRVTKEDAAPLGDACWVELDDPDLEPQDFRPPPSIVVATSPGRHHLYWRLREPLPTEQIQKTNYRLTYGNGVKIDKSGWALTKWLRLPGSISYKRDTPFAVAVKWATNATYGPEDFENLPDAPQLVVGGGRPAPAAPKPADVAAVRAKYALPLELASIVRKERPDRSAALWKAYHLCYRLGMSEEECYALLVRTPNDKFHTEWRYNADDGLWRDICRGYHMAHTPEDRSLAARLREIRGQRINAADKYTEMADVLRPELAQRGGFFYDPVQYEAYYVNGDNKAVRMDPKHDPWNTLIYGLCRMTKSDAGYEAINEHLYHTAAMADDCHVEPHSFAYWDTANGLLYVYNGSGGIYRLDGERIDEVSNGTDGVLFRQDPEMSSFAAVPPAEDALVPTLDSAIFGLPNFVDSETVHRPSEATFIVRTWLYALFFGERFEARPHLVVAGETGSGKTIAFRAIGELLKGPNYDVTTLPSELDQYKVTVSNNRFVFFDNVDEAAGRKWLMDAMAETSTGMRITKRKLYTDNDMMSYKVKCFLGVTTRNPWFARIDVANRMIPLLVERRDDNLDPAELLRPIREHRAALWWELLTDLNKIIVVLKTFQPVPHKMRMAGYADFTMAVCQALGVPSDRILKVLEGAQSTSALDNSVIWQLLQPWLKREDRETHQRTNDGQWVATPRLFQELKTVATGLGMEHEYARKCPNPIVFSRQLGELVPDLKKVIDVDVKKSTQTNRYWFKLRDDPAQEEEVAA